MALKLAQPVKIEDPDEPFLKQAEEIAFEFISLRTKTVQLAAPVKAPIYPKKEAGEPGLLRADEGGEVPQAEPELPLPASLPQLGAEGQQPQQQRQQATGQVTGYQEQQQGATVQLSAVTGGQPSSRVIAERLRAIGDEIDKDIIDSQTKMALAKLFSHSNVTAFTMRREDFTSVCAGILSQFQQIFPSGWHQISFVYHAMFHAILSVRDEGGEISTQTREQQVANYVGPTLTELGLTQWMANHGGMDNFGRRIEGEGAKAIIYDSSVDRES